MFATCVLYSGYESDAAVYFFVHNGFRSVGLGLFRDALIESELVADRGDGRRGSGAQGQRAVTQVRVVERFQVQVEGAKHPISLVECRLETGRTHQVRIHLGEQGTPLCGERIYDRPLHGAPLPDPSGATRPLLHAAVLEIDHPATQGHKRQTLARIGAASPARYVTWNFEERPMEDLPEELAASGHDAARPSFTVWEGVTMYLSEPAIDASLRAIAEWSAPGSRLAMTYFAKSRLAQPSLATRALRFADHLQLLGLRVAVVSRAHRQHLADDPPEHLPGGHAPAAGGRFQFDRLPARQQQREFDHFLVDPGGVGRDPVDQRDEGPVLRPKGDPCGRLKQLLLGPRLRIGRSNELSRRRRAIQ